MPFFSRRNPEREWLKPPKPERLDLYHSAYVFIPNFRLGLAYVNDMTKSEARWLYTDIGRQQIKQEQESRRTGNEYWGSDEFEERAQKVADEIAEILELEKLFQMPTLPKE